LISKVWINAIEGGVRVYGAIPSHLPVDKTAYGIPGTDMDVV
jgi:hypothetical protein